MKPEEIYSQFELSVAIAWAQAILLDHMRTHPDAPRSSLSKVYLEALEGGLSVALDFTHGNP